MIFPDRMISVYLSCLQRVQRFFRLSIPCQYPLSLSKRTAIKRELSIIIHINSFRSSKLQYCLCVRAVRRNSKCSSQYWQTRKQTGAQHSWIHNIVRTNSDRNWNCVWESSITESAIRIGTVALGCGDVRECRVKNERKRARPKFGCALQRHAVSAVSFSAQFSVHRKRNVRDHYQQQQ